MRAVCFAAFLACVISGVLGKSINFTDCGSQGGKIVQVFITPCDQEPCTFTLGETITIEFDFTSNVKSSNASLEASAVILGVKFVLPVPQPDACKLIQCPLLPGKNVYKVVEVVHIPSYVPSDPFAFPLQVTMTGDNDANILCGEVKVKIARPKHGQRRS